MLPLRLPWLWLGAGWLVVAGVCAGSLLPASSMPWLVGLLQIELGDELLHAVSYFVLMVWFSGLCKRLLYGVVGLLLVALGVALEFLQLGVPSRDLDALDIAANGVGVLAGLGLALWLVGGWCQRIERRLFT